jgi:serine/threonine-protein kinase
MNDGPAFPERIGRYDVLLPVASGGMATVYLARSRGVGGFMRDVALKLTHAHLRDHPEFTTDLLDEAKLAVAIRHPNVVPILDVGEDPFGLFLVMDYIEGDTLSGLIRRAGPQKLPEAVALRIVLDALAGLHAAHELRDERGEPLGLVHRDVSPHNVLVGVDGISRLADFGIAKAASRMGQTQSGLLKGKVGYMSPEHARGKSLDRRSDVWAAGVVVWEALAGRRLHGSEDVSTLLKIVTEPAPLLRSVNAAVPGGIEEAVAWALEIDVEARCPSAQAFARSLAQAAKSSFGIAEPDEVGAFVEATVGQRLAERRARIAEVQKLRTRMDRIAATSTRDSTIPTPSPRPRSETPPKPADLEPEPVATTVGPPPDMPAPPSGPTAPRPRPRGWRRPAGVGITVSAGVLLLAGIAAWLGTGRAKGAPSAVPAAPSVPAPVLARTIEPVPPPPTLEPASSQAPVAPVSLEIVANAPIAAVGVDGRETRLDQARRRVSIDVPRPTGSVVVEALSADGRRARARVGPDEPRVVLRFPVPSKKPKLMEWR